MNVPKTAPSGDQSSPLFPTSIQRKAHKLSADIARALRESGEAFTQKSPKERKIELLVQPANDKVLPITQRLCNSSNRKTA